MSENDRMIRFIDSAYRELFRIPDGGNIRITYPPGDDRGTLIRPCQYRDETHTAIGGNTYHICEFAEAMERIGARYEPETQLHAELTPYAAGEEKYFTFNREDSNPCIGHVSGDFGRQGDRFNQNWNSRDNGGSAPEFGAELQSVVYALRRDVLRDRDGMMAYCQSHPEAKLSGEGDLEMYGFKLETDTRRYFVRCFADQDARFIAYAYDKPAPVREQGRGAPAVSANKEKPSVLARLRESKQAAARQENPPKSAPKRDNRLEL